MSFLLHCDHERELNLSNSLFSLVKFMKSLVSFVILLVLLSVTLFGLSNLCQYFTDYCPLSVSKAKKGETGAKIVFVENCGLASLPRKCHPCPPVLSYWHICCSMRLLAWHKKYLVLLEWECSCFPCNYQIFSQNFPKNSIWMDLSKYVLLDGRFCFCLLYPPG